MHSQSPVGKTKSQGWEIGVSRTMPISQQRAWTLMTSALGLPPSISEATQAVPQLGEQLVTEDHTRIELRSYTHHSLIRMKWQPLDWSASSTLQIRVLPAKTGTTISIHHEWLQDADQREAMRVRWTALLDALKTSAAH